MIENREQRIERVTKLLSEGEIYAYEYWKKSSQGAVAASLNAQLFGLFLNGKNTEEIRRLNPLLTLGQIVSARIEGDWDKRRDEHLDRLLADTSGRIQQATMETSELICDMLAVANKEHGDKLRKYLQTGNEADLGDFKVDSLGNLKQAIEVLQKLTGQDKQSKLTLAGEILHRESESDEKKLPTAEQANNVLKLLVGSKK